MQLFPSIIFLLLFVTTATHAHNITRILAKHPEFSTFNHYLTLTHLASEINRRQTITVCAVDNAAMNDLLSKHLSISTLKNVLSLHVLLDYFGARKLHQIASSTTLAATLFQATGLAPGSSGFVNITDVRGGKVGFGMEDNGGRWDSFFLKSVEEIPYYISVIQISKVLRSPEAEAPTPAPSEMNLTQLMSMKGCKVFADLLTESGAVKTYEDNEGSGLTVFCPTDDLMNRFLPKYKNLTADGKVSLLLYHGVPIYQSIPMLKSNNGLMNTLSTDGVNKYVLIVENDGEQVKLKTTVVTARVTGTLINVLPLAVYTVNKVLLPKELFKGAEAPTPAPAPTPEKTADAPKGENFSSPPAPEGPDLAPLDDQTAADLSSGARFYEGWAIAGALGLGVLMLNSISFNFLSFLL